MEPMNLGSTPSSPLSPSGSHQNHQNYLPGFLMGDIPPSTPQYQNVSSPGRNKTPSSSAYKSISNLNDSISLRQKKLFNQTLGESPAATPPPPTTVQSPFGMDQRAGPPRTGLFDTLDAVKKTTTTPILSSTIAHHPANANETTIFNESFSRITPAEETFGTLRSYNNNSSKLEHIDSHWVTVFGFPPSMLNLVISHLSNCGVVADKRIPPQGNWVHLRFNTLTEVSRALSLNGHCVGNNMMIGVQLYYPKENKENTTLITSPSKARSLRHSYVSPQSSNDVLQAQNLPQKSTGIVSKAMEYVFGW